MIASILLTAPLLLLLSPASALPKVSPVLIGAGDCSAYPNSYFHSGDNADAFNFRPDQADNSSINGLHTSIYGINLVAFDGSLNSTNNVASTIFCCDHGGTVLDPFGVQQLLVSNSSNDAELGYLSAGARPETYAHDVDGVRQDGVFLGFSNVTTWGFTLAGPFYKIRLLEPGTENNKIDGEIKGFLKVVPP